jgi:hypothetical protein
LVPVTICFVVRLTYFGSTLTVVCRLWDQRLSEEIAKVPATDPIKDLVGFRAEIERIRHVFKEWRYLYERSSATQIKFVEFTRVLDFLHNTCRVDDRLEQGQANT